MKPILFNTEMVKASLEGRKTAQEALDILISKTSIMNDTCAKLEDCLKDGECRFKVDDDNDCEDYKIAKKMQELVERATPMNLIEHHYEVIGEEPYIKYNCPNCNNRAYPHMKFCSNCGQAIDWSK